MLVFEELYYHASSPSQQVDALIEKSRCQKAQQKHYDALSTIQRIDKSVTNDSLKAWLYYETSLLYYLTGNFEESWHTIEQAKIYVEEPLFPSSFSILEILVAHRLLQWDQGRSLLVTYLHSNGIDTLVADTIYRALKKMKDPEKASKLSMFLPGAGQFYAGSVKNGMISTTLHGLLIWYIIGCVHNSLYITAALSGVQTLFRFYKGGIKNASFYAQKRNGVIIENVNRNILELILTTETTL